jgi:hypothetical protein
MTPEELILNEKFKNASEKGLIRLVHTEEMSDPDIFMACRVIKSKPEVCLFRVHWNEKGYGAIYNFYTCDDPILQAEGRQALMNGGFIK